MGETSFLCTNALCSVMWYVFWYGVLYDVRTSIPYYLPIHYTE